MGTLLSSSSIQLVIVHMLSGNGETDSYSELEIRASSEEGLTSRLEIPASSEEESLDL